MGGGRERSFPNSCDGRRIESHKEPLGIRIAGSVSPPRYILSAQTTCRNRAPSSRCISKIRPPKGCRSLSVGYKATRSSAPKGQEAGASLSLSREGRARWGALKSYTTRARASPRCATMLVINLQPRNGSKLGKTDGQLSVS
jgi:hypothetical protein